MVRVRVAAHHAVDLHAVAAVVVVAAEAVAAAELFSINDGTSAGVGRPLSQIDEIKNRDHRVDKNGKEKICK